MLDTIHDTRYNLGIGGGGNREEYHSIGHVPVFKFGAGFLGALLLCFITP